jgi:Fe-S cluster biosynthesis and repair protein YggX
MARIIFCRKYRSELEGLEAPPYPGPRGQEIFETVSKQAWQEWLAHQTMLINEKQLNMMDADSRKYLQGEMDKFLSGEDYDKAEGYIPPAPDNP